MHSVEEAQRWLEPGVQLVARTLDGIDDAALEEPSALPGWTRKHVLSHLAGNADALGNLLRWARTGERTPMYASVEARNAAIEDGARLPAGELRAAYAEAERSFRDELDAVAPEQWQAQVETSRGAPIPASEVPWLRTRELMIHAVDLGGPTRFGDLPRGFLEALVDEVTVERTAAGAPAVELLGQDTGSAWRMDGVGEPVRLLAPIADLAAWLTGREGKAPKCLVGALPDLPAWR